ncbi:uncharacterized protein LY79DRAFT_346046 [Colletotrichum navitas]|uniref:Uncharacterized protein n=1 Tax=Colletotrichum navitas TaxID=681940 RepID=A0AAD8PRD1_9PEZI|nr:uncharacterized protein LY79DRAFT_346046 [Colletotrichum navitas]KAK1579301.1 hypothetical protein LY79DRAFT_346046 [Colletotrichum navitas]
MSMVWCNISGHKNMNNPSMAGRSVPDLESTSNPALKPLAIKLAGSLHNFFTMSSLYVCALQFVNVSMSCDEKELKKKKKKTPPSTTCTEMHGNGPKNLEWIQTLPIERRPGDPSDANNSPRCHNSATPRRVETVEAVGNSDPKQARTHMQRRPISPKMDSLSCTLQRRLAFRPVSYHLSSPDVCFDRFLVCGWVPKVNDRP